MNNVFEIGPLYHLHPWSPSLLDEVGNPILCRRGIRDYFSIPIDKFSNTKWFVRIALSKPDHDERLLVSFDASARAHITDHDMNPFHQLHGALYDRLRSLNIKQDQQYYVWLEEEEL